LRELPELHQVLAQIQARVVEQHRHDGLRGSCKMAGGRLPLPRSAPPINGPRTAPAAVTRTPAGLLSPPTGCRLQALPSARIFDPPRSRLHAAFGLLHIR
jgi:hypothetical protein